MHKLTLSELRSYDYWKGKPAHQIYWSVFARQGWKRVWPGEVPQWASRVRNYFNITPTWLVRLSHKETVGILRRFDHMNFWADGIGGLYTSEALTEFVYADIARQRPWILMAPAGSVYHTGDGTAGLWKKIKTLFGGQDSTAFKLVSPDGNGGSHELIVQNQKKDERFGDTTGRPFSVIADFDDLRRGSYNFAETAVVGFDEHERMDVDTHVGGSRQFYVNPEDPYAPLERRKLPWTLPFFALPRKKPARPPQPKYRRHESGAGGHVPFGGRRARGGQYY